MKKFVLMAMGAIMGCSVFAQMPCETPVPCTEPVQNPVYCYTPASGCGYDYYSCDQPALVDRYAELAGKYNHLGPSDRWNAIYNGNNEVMELQSLDNYYTKAGVPDGLNQDQVLKLKTAQGSILR